jgi:hypothetical protein
MVRTQARSPDKAACAPDHPYLAGFLAQLRQERRLSPHTAQGYARDVRKLLALAGPIPLEDLQLHQIRRFVAQLHGRNPCTGIRAPKSPKSLPKALSPDEATRLVSLPGDDPLAVRDRAIFELFYSSGLRLSELTALTPSDLNFTDATVRVLGKGAKTRVVPVGSYALQALQDWMRLRAGLVRDADAGLFTRTCCATRLPRTCCNPAATCAPSRNCSATPASPPRRCTRIWIFSTWPRSTTKAIQERRESPDDGFWLRRNVGSADVSLRRNKSLRDVLSVPGQGLRPGPSAGET